MKLAVKGGSVFVRGWLQLTKKMCVCVCVLEKYHNHLDKETRFKILEQ